MGLDATVYCNCYEQKRLKEPPPKIGDLYVGEDGSLNCRTQNLKHDLAFDKWLHNRACEHEDGVYLHHYLGNVSLIALLRSEIESQRKKFPIILEKIIYSGSHCGDYLKLEAICQLNRELDELSKFRSDNIERQYFIDIFCGQVRDLVQASLQQQKPISF